MYGALVAEARHSRGLTQAQLAAVSGIEQANISAIERGHRSPSAATIHRLLHACGYELTATAGDRVLVCPPPVDDPVYQSLLQPSPMDEPPVVDRHTTMSVRARVLVAALEAAEATVRAR